MSWPNAEVITWHLSLQFIRSNHTNLCEQILYICTKINFHSLFAHSQLISVMPYIYIIYVFWSNNHWQRNQMRTKCMVPLCLIKQIHVGCFFYWKKAYCRSMNARLVEVETEAESNYLESQLRVIHQHGKPPGTFGYSMSRVSSSGPYFTKNTKDVKRKLYKDGCNVHCIPLNSSIETFAKHCLFPRILMMYVILYNILYKWSIPVLWLDIINMI